jgi:tetratricopeptide (TPR) repeat protein
VGLLLLLSGASGAAEPFYELRFQEGVRAYAGERYGAAIRDLRIACFGFLEEPESLARCLTYLALAQAAAGDREAFSASFLRLLDVEQRFQAYSRAELAPDVRRAFEARLELWEPYEALRSVGAFAAVARRVLEARIAAMPEAERRRELERRLAAEPGDALWRLLTAELELAAGDFEAASAAAESVLERGPEESLLPRALCVRGRARAALGACEAALRDLPACAAALGGIDVTETTLRCYAQLGDWKRGIVLLSELPEERRRSPAIRKLARLFEQERRQEIREIRGDGG